MEKSDNNLMKGVERLSKLMAHVQLLKGQVSIIERDLLLQELRDLYMEVLSMDVTTASNASLVNEEAKEVVAFENIMKDVHEVEESKPVQVSKVEEEVASKEEHREVEGLAIEMNAAVAEKLEKAVAEFKEEKHEEKVEVQQPVVEMTAEEESPFAPAEPEPEMEPAPEPVMEKIEGNQYEELFEDTVAKVEVEKPVEKVEAVVEPEVEKVAVVEEKPVERVEPIVEKVEPVVEKVEPMVEKTKPAMEEPRMELKKEEVKLNEKPIVEHKVEKHEEKVVKEETPMHKADHKAQPKATQPSLFDYLSASVAPTVAEKPVAPTLADKLSGAHPILESQLEHKVNAQKVSDLRTVININDKFSFMTELFHNNMKAYNDFILKLNAISDRDEAMTYVESVAKEYAWDSNSLAVKTFYKVMERKF